MVVIRRDAGTMFRTMVFSAALAVPAWAADDSSKSSGAFDLNPTRDFGMALAQAPKPAEPGQAVAGKQVETETVKTEPISPLRFGLGYYLFSDYVWRAKNLSEYLKEGREKPNHQMTTSISWVTKDFGEFGFDMFFQWYAAQSKLDPIWGGHNLQEVDYQVWWQYMVEPIATNVRVSYTYDVFPNAAKRLRQDKAPGNDNDDRTQYWTIILNHNDAWMWKGLFPENKGGILNPMFLISQDFGVLAGVWSEFGFSHDFTIPGVDNLTITPSWKLFTDCNYWSRGMKLAGDQWGLVTAYDLTPLLHLPTWVGKLVLKGHLYFNNAFGTMEDTDVLHDEFWGGMSVNWSWGG